MAISKVNVLVNNKKKIYGQAIVKAGFREKFNRYI